MKKLLYLALIFLQVSALGKEFKVENRVNEHLQATVKNNYAEFIKNGSDDFKKLDKAEFEKVAKQLSPKIKEGMDLMFLTTLNQGPYLVHLFKLSFKNKKEDALVKIVLGEKNETLGFWIQ